MSRTLFGLLTLTGIASADPPDLNQPEEKKLPPLTVPLPTLGGLQFWADVFVFNEWRVQHNVVLDIYRLIDGNAVARCIGSETQCIERFVKIRQSKQLEADRTPTVFLLSGITRTRHAMRPLARKLESAGYRVYTLSYPSTRRTISEHATNLNRLISRFEGPSEIHFVGHSMGGLVFRKYLDEYGDDRVKRFVMLGTPNRGAVRADQWKSNVAYRIVFGRAGQELGTDDDSIVQRLPEDVPEGIEVGIIAGGKGNDRGFSRSIEGDDDMTVSVDSTKLPGATDFVVVRGLHSFLMNKSAVHEYVQNYLQHGYFRSATDRRPIPRRTKQTAN